MGKGILGIYDSDGDYAERLMEYLNRKRNFPLEAQLFTKEEAMKAALEEGSMEIALVSERLSLAGMEQGHIQKIIYLSEGGFVGEEDNQKVLYKYQSAEELIKEILDCCLEEGERIPIVQGRAPEGKTVIVSVFSPCGGCGKTGLSFALAEYLERSRRALLISWELFPAKGGRGGEEGTDGFSELMYYIRQGKGSAAYKLKAMVQKVENVSCLLPAAHYKDLYELEGEDVEKLVAMLLAYGGYEAVIFDIGFINDAVVRLLELSDRVYMPLPEGRPAGEKAECFYECLEKEKKSLLVEKCQMVRISSELLERAAAGKDGFGELAQGLVETWKKD